MNKVLHHEVLDHEQIESPVCAAPGEAAASSQTTTGAKVSVWDPRQAGQIDGEQMRAIRLVHEAFATNLTDAMGAFLRSGFEAALVSAEYLSYGEFLRRTPEGTCLASCKLAPLNVTALLQMDSSIAFPLVDLLLGGEGKGEPPARALTEIEQEILETAVQIVFQELQKAWSALALEFQFAQCQPREEAQRLLPFEEKILSLSFEMALAEGRGTMNLAIPAVVFQALLRKVSAQYDCPKPRARLDSSSRLRTLLQQCMVPVELGIATVRVPMPELMRLAPGSVLFMNQPLDQPATLSVSGLPVFSALVARHGAWRAAQVISSPTPRPVERKVLA